MPKNSSFISLRVSCFFWKRKFENLNTQCLLSWFFLQRSWIIWISCQDLLFLSTILKNLASTVFAKILAKMQEFFWQENRDSKLWVIIHETLFVTVNFCREFRCWLSGISNFEAENFYMYLCASPNTTSCSKINNLKPHLVCQSSNLILPWQF